VQRSVLGTDVTVLQGAHVTGSVLMDNVTVGEGARVLHAILDKNVVVPPGARIGVDRDEDLARGFMVTDSGLTVLSKGQKVTA
jgi:glucose-1-phosphate adenylyltransferase